MRAASCAGVPVQQQKRESVAEPRTLKDAPREVALSELYPVKKVPQRVPPNERGNLHPRVPIRWAMHGVYGIRLRFVCAGRQKLTCDAWLREFLEAVARAQLQAREVQQ